MSDYFAFSSSPVYPVDPNTGKLKPEIMRISGSSTSTTPAPVYTPGTLDQRTSFGAPAANCSGVHEEDETERMTRALEAELEAALLGPIDASHSDSER